MKVTANIFWRSSHRLLFFAFLGLFSIFSHPQNLHARNTVIRDFTAVNSNNQLTLYLTVNECFTEEMISAVHNGIPITFTFYIDIYRTRTGWLDKKLKEYRFNHTMEYDSLKKEYTVRREEKGDSRSTASLEEAKMIMAEINGFRAMPMEDISPQATYIIKAKAKLARKALPLYFHYLIPFTSMWDFETEWYQLTLRLTL